MNKLQLTLVSLILATIIPLFSSGCANSEQVVIRPEFRLNKYEEDFKPKTLKDIVSFKHYNLEPTEDIGEYWQSPAQTRKRKKGDCDDSSLFSANSAEKQGYPPLNLILFNNTESAHIVDLLKKETPQGTRYGMIDVDIGLYPVFPSIKELIGKMNQMRKGYVPKINPYKDSIILDLRKVDCDWRTSKENLWPRVCKEAGILTEYKATMRKSHRRYLEYIQDNPL